MASSSMFVYSWWIEEANLEDTIIRAYGIDADKKNICLRIENFTPYCYIELPTHINDKAVQWNESKASALVSKLEFMVGSAVQEENFEFVKKSLMFKKKLFYAHLDKEKQRKLFPFLFVSVRNKDHIQKLGWRTKKPIFVDGIGLVSVRLHETDASPVLQLTSLKKIPTAGWINFRGEEIKSNNKLTHCDEEYIVRWQNLSEDESKASTVGDPMIMSFDIEVNSSNPNMMPVASKPNDKIFQLSAIFSRSSSSTLKKILLTLGETTQKDVGEDVEIIHCKTEASLLMGYTNLIQRFQPNVIIGYNIFKFDIPYMIDRAQLLQCDKFDMQGFCKNEHARRKTIKWSSSAYKNQEYEFLDAEGRLFIDLLPIVQRDNRLSDYKLSTVAQKFIGATKDPLDHKGIFKCYSLGMKGVSPSSSQEDKEAGRKAMSLVGKYCIQDAVLVSNLFRVLMTWTGLSAMAKVCNVPIFTTFTQGQQIKVYSQVYKKCTHDNIVVEKDGYITKPTDHYIGATVFPPKPGLYQKVLPFDFASLYPTSMIAFNICYSTLVLDDKIPDDECHVMEWDEHLGCIHDPKIVRIAELDKIILKMTEEQKELRRLRDLKSNKDKRAYYQEQIQILTNKMRPIREERVEIKKTKYKHVMCEHRKFRWLKSPMGVLPTILKNLLDARAKAKKEMKAVAEMLSECKEHEKEALSIKRDVLDAHQTALKISANSIYGSLGVVKGYLPFMPGAMATTFKGRTLIERAAESIRDDHKGVLIYGDSVTGDTPIITRDSNGNINIMTIETIGDSFIPYTPLYSEQTKEQCFTNLEVWSNGIFTPIKRIIRHKTTKNVFRINTHSGCVDVTEDHSLLTKDGDTISPTNIDTETELLHSFPTVDMIHTGFVENRTDVETIDCARCKANKPIYDFYTDYRHCKECCWKENGRNRKGLRGVTKVYFSEHEYINKIALTVEEAFVWGFFFGDGSCGSYNGKNTWALNNSSIDILERCKGYLQQCEPHFEFKIYDTLESSGVYKLVCTGKVRLIVLKYRPLFYDKDKYKKVPIQILNASLDIKKAFIDGYWTADGEKVGSASRCECKGAIGSQGLLYLLKSIGYEVSVSIRQQKENTYKLTINKSGNSQRKNPDIVKKIINLGATTQYVYDIEADGKFQAGVGQIVVHNTDSNYVSFPHCNTAEECWTWAERVSKEVTKLFPPPISLAFEQKIYWEFFILTKKRYMSLTCKRDGTLDKEIAKKGVLLARRDNCGWIRQIYERVMHMVFSREKRDTILNYIVEDINKMFMRLYPRKMFVMTKSVGDVGGKDEKGNLIPIYFRNEKGVEKVLMGSYKVNALKHCPSHDNYNSECPNCYKQALPQLKKKSEEDSAFIATALEFYKRSLPAQVQLAERMRERGQIVDAGSRIEYVVTVAGGHLESQADKIEDVTYCYKHPDSIQIDYLDYLRQLANPLDQVLFVMYPEVGEFVERQYRLRLQRDKMLKELMSVFYPKIVDDSD